MNAEVDGDTATGFTLSRVLAGTPAEVFAHFTEPALFSRWFVVEGYTTPASRISLDPRPEGTISAVMLPDDGGPEIPFTATYGIVEPQRRIQFKFTDPTEMVTISLTRPSRGGYPADVFQCRRSAHRTSSGTQRSRADARCIGRFGGRAAAEDWCLGVTPERVRSSCGYRRLSRSLRRRGGRKQHGSG